MKILNYSKERQEAWEYTVLTSRNGTWMNLQKFLDYHEGKFEDNSLMFYKKDECVAVFPAAKLGNILYSHPGATYGGIIISPEIDLKHIDKIIDLIIEYAKDNNYKKIYIKPPPRIYHIHPSDEVDFLLWKKGFTIKRRDLTTCVTKKSDGLFVKDSCTRAYKKALKYVTYRKTSKLKDFWNILEENLRIKHGVKPTHTLEEIKHLREKFPIYLYGAFLGDKMIAGALLFNMNSVMHCQYIAMDYNYQKYRPLNLLFNSLIFEMRLTNTKYFNFGVSTENFGEEINWGLYRFKESFGGMGILHEWYTYVI